MILINQPSTTINGRRGDESPPPNERSVNHPYSLDCLDGGRTSFSTKPALLSTGLNLDCLSNKNALVPGSKPSSLIILLTSFSVNMARGCSMISTFQKVSPLGDISACDHHDALVIKEVFLFPSHQRIVMMFCDKFFCTSMN